MLVIGYAFGDVRLRSSIAECLYMEDKATLLVVDPNASSARIKKLFPFLRDERICIINGSFGESDTLTKIQREIENRLVIVSKPE